MLWVVPNMQLGITTRSGAYSRSFLSLKLTNFNRAELDREQAAIIENNSRGLGLQGEWMGESKWYGGRIQQIVHLVKVSNNDKEKSVRYELKLGRMQMGRSHRFARFLGSRRILQIKLPKDYSTDWALMKKYFLQKFVLCGRVYVPFSVKDGKLYSMEINEDYERAVQVGEGDHYRLSLDEFVRWHNPMDLNAKQVRVSRSLLLESSLTILGCRFRKSANGCHVLTLGYQRRSRPSSSSRKI